MGPKIFALVVILVFFAVMIGIGFYYNKKGQADTNSDDYILAGRKAPLLIVAGSLFATWVSSAGHGLCWQRLHRGAGLFLVRCQLHRRHHVDGDMAHPPSAQGRNHHGARVV